MRERKKNVLGILLDGDDVLLGEGLHAMTDVAGGGGLEAKAAHTTVDVSTISLAQSSNSGSTTKVDLAGNGCSADVVPVSVVRGELTTSASLDHVVPLGEFHLAALLEMLGQSINEDVCGNILDSLSFLHHLCAHKDADEQDTDTKER